MEPLTVVLMLAYGGGFADNVGIRAAGYSGPFGASVGVAYTKYLTVTAGPEARFDVGATDLVVRANYAFDHSSAHDVDLSTHSAFLSVGLQADLGEQAMMEASVTPVRYPFDVNSTVDGEDRDVPIDATDSSFFLPGVSVGYRVLD
jgi:hypothetical protein